MNILVASSETADHLRLKQKLEKEGHQVLHAYSIFDIGDLLKSNFVGMAFVQDSFGSFFRSGKTILKNYQIPVFSISNP